MTVEALAAKVEAADAAALQARRRLDDRKAAHDAALIDDNEADAIRAGEAVEKAQSTWATAARRADLLRAELGNAEREAQKAALWLAWRRNDADGDQVIKRAAETDAALLEAGRCYDLWVEARAAFADSLPSKPSIIPWANTSQLAGMRLRMISKMELGTPALDASAVPALKTSALDWVRTMQEKRPADAPPVRARKA